MCRTGALVLALLCFIHYSACDINIGDISEKGGLYLVIQNELAHLSAKVDQMRAEVAALDRRVATQTEEHQRALQGISKTIQDVDTQIGRHDYYTGRYVYLIRSRRGLHKLSYATAANECEKQGAHLATKAQLDAAFAFGMDMCSCGWLLDKSIYYLTQWPRQGCLGRGLHKCTGHYRDGYCFKKGYTGPLIVTV